MGEFFHLHLIGILFKDHLPALLIGYYAWEACMSSDRLLFGRDEILDMLKPLGFEHIDI